MFPFQTERIDLPSKGLVYPKSNPLSKGYVDMRYMTAFHEDILTNLNYINRGIQYTLDKFSQALIVDKDININDLIEGDRFQILLASRILSYGHIVDYEYKGKPLRVDLTKLPNKKFDESLFSNTNDVPFELPWSGINISIKLLTHGDLLEIEEEANRLKELFPDDNFDKQLKLKKIIQSVEKDYSKETIQNFVDNKLVGVDIREIIMFHNEISPEVDIKAKDSEGGEEHTIPFRYLDLFYDIKRIPKVGKTRD